MWNVLIKIRIRHHNSRLQFTHMIADHYLSNGRPPKNPPQPSSIKSVIQLASTKAKTKPTNQSCSSTRFEILSVEGRIDVLKSVGESARQSVCVCQQPERSGESLDRSVEVFK
eukprot:Selendium_serpulae@DN642_c0_g1_i1.p1